MQSTEQFKELFKNGNSSSESAKWIPQSLQATGAYVSLSTLQQLRHLVKRGAISNKRNSMAMLNGQHKSRAISRGMEFEDVRPYQPGDDIRSIDWRVTARTQVTHSKRYTEEKEKPIITAVDQRQSTFFGSNPCFKSVYSCHLAALINWATLQAGDRSGGIVLGNQSIEETRPARSHKTVNRWLQQLTTANHQLSATADTIEEPSLSQWFERIIHSTPTGTHVYIISDFYGFDESCEKYLFHLAQHHQITLLWVMDKLEMQLPNASSLYISRGGKHKKSTEHIASSSSQLTLHKNAAVEFTQLYQDKKNTLTQLSQRLGIRLVEAPVQTVPTEIIQRAL